MAGVRAVLILALLLAAPAAAAAGDVEQGRRVAEKWCARCHVVGTAKPFGGIGSTPSFFLMSDQFDNYRQRVGTFKDRRPHIAQEFDDVTKDDIDHLLAYIGNLERP